jgi:hypothetical protein
VAADIPQELSELIERCLAKEMDDRPANADEMIQNLDALRANDPWTEADAAVWWQGIQKTEEV